MSLSDYLSKEEVDALMSESDKSIIHQSGAHEFQWFDVANIKHDDLVELTGIHLINELFNQRIFALFAGFLRDDLTVKSLHPSVTTLEKLQNAQKAMSVYVEVILTETKQVLLIRISQELLYQAISILFGGKPSSADAYLTQKKILSKIDESIVVQLSEIIMTAMGRAWEQVAKFAHEFGKVTTYGKTITSIAPSENLVVFESVVRFGDVFQGDFAVCFPRQVIEPYQAVLKHGNKAKRDEKEEQRWHEKLSENVMECPIELRVMMPERAYLFKEIMALQVGSVLSIDAPTLVNVFTGGIPLFKALVGESSGNVALEVLSSIK